MTEYSHPEILVNTDWVKQNLGKPGVKLVEVDVDTKVPVRLTPWLTSCPSRG